MTDEERLRTELRMHWSMFFAAIASLQEHPGMNRENATPKSIEESAAMADQMLGQVVVRIQRGDL